MCLKQQLQMDSVSLYRNGERQTCFSEEAHVKHTLKRAKSASNFTVFNERTRNVDRKAAPTKRNGRRK